MEGQSRSLSSKRGLEERQKRSHVTLTALPGGCKGAQTTRTSRRDHELLGTAAVREAPYRFHQKKKQIG